LWAKGSPRPLLNALEKAASPANYRRSERSMSHRLRANRIHLIARKLRELARISREFPLEEFHLSIRATDAVAVSLDVASASARASQQLGWALRSPLR